MLIWVRLGGLCVSQDVWVYEYGIYGVYIGNVVIGLEYRETTW